MNAPTNHTKKKERLMEVLGEFNELFDRNWTENKYVIDSHIIQPRCEIQNKNQKEKMK